MLKPASVFQQPSTVRIAGICQKSSLVLAACLVFLVPFDAARNIDLQGFLLIVSGCFAWVAILLGQGKFLASPGLFSRILLGIFGIACLISFLVNPHSGYNFFGAPYIRLGIGGWLACFGIGLLASTVPKRQLLGGLYILIAGLSVVSVPYILLHLHSMPRAGGVIAQADILACFLGCGLLFGLEMFTLYPKRRQAIIALQVLMGGLLLITQTRAVILLVLGLGLVWIFQPQGKQALARIVIYAAAAIVLFAAWNYLAPTRLTDTAYASRSFHYRLTLQDYALRATAQKPLWGYGPGNLADALYCPHLLDKALQTTCDEGYFFNSSHNIFLDRVLAVGWLGGLAFAGLVLLAVYRAFRANYKVFGYALVLISCYYLTNVTSVTLELLLWVLLVYSLAANRASASR